MVTKIRKNILIFCLVLAGYATEAQQLPQFTQYMFNMISVNPAYAGSRETLNVTALHRQQWAGINGNPVTSTVSMHLPTKNERVGLGFSFITDQLGFEVTNYVYGDFSYSIPVSYNARLSFGLKGGYTRYSKADADAFDNGEVAVNVWNPNFGAGAYLSTEKWYVGISSPRILTTDLNTGEFEALERNAYYGIAGYVFDISADVKFRPTVLAKLTNGAPASYDLTASFLLYDKFWLGATARLNDTSNLGAYMDYQVSNNIRIGYAYDLPTTLISGQTDGTHEVILIYEPRFSKKTKLYKSPRYF
jgi:type IX secretion system PorP/SprF family membrane protein